MSLFSFWEMLSPSFQASSPFLPLLHLSVRESGRFPQAFHNIPSATPPCSVPHFPNWMCIWLPWESSSRADSEWVGLEWGLRFCISNKLLWEAEAAGPVQRCSEKQDLREQCLHPASNTDPTAPRATSPTEMLMGCNLRATTLNIQWGSPFWMITIFNLILYGKVCICMLSRSVLSDSGLQHVRIPCPSPTPRAGSRSCPSSPWYSCSVAGSRLQESNVPQYIRDGLAQGQRIHLPTHKMQEMIHPSAWSPGWGGSPGGGNGKPLQYSCLENCRDRESRLQFVGLKGHTHTHTQVAWVSAVALSHCQQLEWEGETVWGREDCGILRVEGT